MQLTKHHGLGNDFLVLLDLDGRHPISTADAVAVCDRTTGIGADGLVRAERGTATDLVMQLVNADGSPAEMSGNGISCLGQAALLLGAARGDTISIDTAAGTRHLELAARPDGRSHTVRVDMGAVTVGEERSEWAGGDVLAATSVDVGNPHLVLRTVDPDGGPDLEEVGRAANASIPGGVNVEVVAPGPGEGELTMRVYERGVGVTDACGTGACAAAAAARGWNLVPERVTVHQPGGPVVVELGPQVRYEVTVEAVATVGWPWP